MSPSKVEFDLRALADRTSYSPKIRGGLIIVGLLFLAANLADFFLNLPAALGPPSPAQAHAGGVIGLVIVLQFPLSALVLYVAVLKIARQPDLLRVTEQGVEFQFRDGKKKTFAWDRRGTVLVIEDSRAGGGHEGSEGLLREFAFPSTWFPAGAIDAIIRGADAHSLEVARNPTSRKGQKFDRVVISSGD